MDGHFVPNITIGPPVLKSIRPLTTLPLDVHLMIENPEDYVDAFAGAGADWITVHVETCVHLHRVIQQIHAHGIPAGVALNPATPLSTLEEILPDLEMVLVMSVNPGFGGQQFVEGSLDQDPEVAALARRARLERRDSGRWWCERGDYRQDRRCRRDCAGGGFCCVRRQGGNRRRNRGFAPGCSARPGRRNGCIVVAKQNRPAESIEQAGCGTS